MNGDGKQTGHRYSDFCIAEGQHEKQAPESHLHRGKGKQTPVCCSGGCALQVHLLVAVQD